jgi:hypothetical protein
MLCYVCFLGCATMAYAAPLGQQRSAPFYHWKINAQRTASPSMAKNKQFASWFNQRQHKLATCLPKPLPLKTEVKTVISQQVQRPQKSLLTQIIELFQRH